MKLCETPSADYGLSLKLFYLGLVIISLAQFPLRVRELPQGGFDSAGFRIKSMLSIRSTPSILVIDLNASGSEGKVSMSNSHVA
jgi:hypothetical protein